MTVMFGKVTFITGTFFVFVAIAAVIGGTQVIYYATIEAIKEQAFIDKEMEG